MSHRRQVLAGAAAGAALLALGAVARRAAAPPSASPSAQPSAHPSAPATATAPPPEPPRPGAAFEPFDFVALGDMPYGPDTIRGPAYRHLIDQINAMDLRFAIHIGDFKDGLAACTDAEFALQHQYFQRFAGALVYTPGDNDWLDCQRRGDDSLERLHALRQRFFASPLSQGLKPLALERQADLMPAFARYVENQRWQHHGVVFATFHTVGPDNAMNDPHAPVRAEARVREAANAAWITAAFALARSQGARALVLATQAETLTYPDRRQRHRGVVGDSFATSIGRTLLPLAEAAPFPVLLIHGDTHVHIIDRPFYNPQGQKINNLWRLEVFGEPRMHAVRVRINPPVAGQGVDPARPFAFAPIWNPLSPDPRMTAHTEP